MLIAGGSFARTPAVPAGDEAIARQAMHEIRMYPYYSVWDNVNLRVVNGTAELSGDVSQPVKKADLGRIVARVPGVTAVDNELNVAPLSPFDNQLRVQVARAIFRNPVLSQYAIQPVPAIHIIVNNGHVRLEGMVRTQSEKDVAGIAASSSMSFGAVTNNLRVEQPSKKG
jgi:hyperosmotically inducible protein